MDESLVRQKVLQRVPWLKLNESGTKLDSWNTCATVLVSRTKRSLSPSSKWLVIDDIRAATKAPSKENRCVPWDFMDERHQSDTPIFADVEFLVNRKTSLKGNTLKHLYVEVDLRSLETKSCENEKRSWENDKKESGTRSEKDKKESGTKSEKDEKSSNAKSSNTHPEIYLLDDTSTNIRIISENNNLLLVRINSQSECQQLQECLIHKDKCLKDDSGNYIVDESLLTVIKPRRGHGETFTTLLPGDMGAIMLKSITAYDKEVAYEWPKYRYTHYDPYDRYGELTQEIYVHKSDYFGVKYDENVLDDADLETGFKSCLIYVEPTPDLRHVMLCYLPTLACDYNNGSTFLSYNGYLYFYFEGVFVQLWVDMGFQRLLDLGESRQVLGLDGIDQKYDTQALTACNTSFPVMPVNLELVDVNSRQNIVQQERYMANLSCCTFEFFDLLTGETYSNFASRLLPRDRWKGYVSGPRLLSGLYVPYISPKGPGFAHVGDELLKVLQEELLDLSLLDEEDRYVNLLDFYEIPKQPHKSSSPSSGVFDTISREKKMPMNNMSDANPKRYRPIGDLLRRVESVPQDFLVPVDMDALLATPYTYALQQPIEKRVKDHHYYDDGPCDHEIYDIRLERSRSRDEAHHRGEMYKGWHCHCAMGGYEYEGEEYDPVRWQKEMDAYLEEFPDMQYSGSYGYGYNW